MPGQVPFESLYRLPRLSCSAGTGSFLIHPDGDVSPCSALYYGYGEVMGNVRDAGLREAILSARGSTRLCGDGTCVAECDAHQRPGPQREPDRHDDLRAHEADAEDDE